MYQNLDEVLAETAKDQVEKECAELGDKFLESSVFRELMVAGELAAGMSQRISSAMITVAVAMFEAGRKWGRSEVLAEIEKKEKG